MSLGRLQTVNYYEHHLGDYARDAGHLSMVEEGAYRRLIDAYYARESPLPLDISQCKKLARVTRAPAEHRAVEYVLSQFFTKEADGYHQNRCDEEIQRFRSKSNAAKANAAARWNHADASNPHMRNGSGRIPAADATASIPHQVGNALQSPISSLQSPSKNPTHTLPAQREGPSLREQGKNRRSLGTNPRSVGDNPRALGANPRAARDERKAAAEEGIAVWEQLIASEGAKPKRTQQIQDALDAIGGWTAIQMRTSFDSKSLRSRFCEAYRSQSGESAPKPPPNQRIDPDDWREREEAAHADG